MEIDFKALNEAIDSAYPCKTENCDRRVSEQGSFCMGCFTGLISGETERIPAQFTPGVPFRYVKKT